STIPAIPKQALRRVIGWVVSNTSGTDLIEESSLPEDFLHTAQFRNGQRALQRIVAARVEKHHDRRLSAEPLAVSLVLASVILQGPTVEGARGGGGPSGHPATEETRDSLRQPRATSARRQCRIRTHPFDRGGQFPHRARTAAARRTDASVHPEH